MASPKRIVRVLSAAVSVTVFAGFILTACGNAPDENTVAKYLPENASGLVTVALSPSTKQQANMLIASQHLPSDIRAKQATEVRDNLLRDMFKAQKVDFATEIKPWLGTEAAAAVVPPVDGSHVPIVLGAVQAKNEKLAIETLQKHHVDSGRYRLLKGYIFFIDEDQFTKHKADKALDAAEQVVQGKAKSLQDNQRYRDNIKSLHGEHIVLGWIDVPSLTKEGVAAAREEQKQAADEQKKYKEENKLDASSDPYSGASSYSSLLGSLGMFSYLAPGFATDTEDSDAAFDKIQASADEMGTYSFEIWLDGNTAIFQGATEHIQKDIGDSTNRAILKGLPADTIAAVDVSDFGAALRKAFDQLTSGKDAPWAEFDKNTPEVRSLLNSLGNEAVGVIGPGDPLTYGFVADVRDADGAKKSTTNIVELLKKWNVTSTDFAVDGGIGFGLADPATTSAFSTVTEDGAVDPAPAETSKPVVFIGVANSRFVIADSEAHVKDLLQGGGKLGESAEVHKAFGDVEHLTFGSVYVNLQAAVDAAAKETAKTDGKKPDAKTQAWLDALDVGGAQTWTDNGHEYSEVRLALK